MKTNLLISIFLLLGLSSCKISNSSSFNSNSSISNSTIQEEKNNNIDVIILTGQSNAEGHTWNNELFKNVEKAQAKQYIDGYDNVKIRFNCNNGLNYCKDFQSVKLGYGLSTNQFGPEIGIAEYLNDVHEFLNNDVYIIKYAVGGTSLYSDWRSPSSSTNNTQTGKLYTNLINYIDESIDLLKKQDLVPSIKAICFMQGESDSTSIGSSVYEELEDNFIKDIKNHIETTQNEIVQFIDAGISDCPNWSQYYKIINQAKKNNVLKDSTNRYYFDTVDDKLEYRYEPTSNPDINHYDSLSMIELGKLFSKTLFENAII